MLSVIVPVYNAEKYLSKCIESLSAQKYADMEIILVDDGSSDESGKICDGYASEKIRVVHKENGGLISAWKTGVTAANGDMIGFVDADDYADEDYFSELATAMERDESDMCIGGFITEYPGEFSFCSTGSAVLKPGVYENEALEEIKNAIFREKNLLFWARWIKVVKRDIIMRNIPLFDERIRVGEDLTFTIATLFDSKRITLVDTHGYHYVQSGGSMMRRFRESETENFRLLCESIDKICEEKGYGEFKNSELYRQLLLVLYKIIKSDLKNGEKKAHLKKVRDFSRVKELLKDKNRKSLSFKGRVAVRLFERKLYFIMLYIGRA